MKNFAVGDKVEIINIPDVYLCNRTGVILGTYTEHAENSFYIILLDVPYHGEKGIVLTDACLRKVID